MEDGRSSPGGGIRPEPTGGGAHTSIQAFLSGVLYLSHDAFNNIQAKISQIDQLVLIDEAS